MGWKKEQEIGWVEQRVRERELIAKDKEKPEHQKQNPEWNKVGELSREDYLAWLHVVRDKRSFQMVGKMLFGGDRAPDAAKARARRAWQRVEWEFGRGALKRKRKPLGFVILGGQIVRR